MLDKTKGFLYLINIYLQWYRWLWIPDIFKAAGVRKFVSDCHLSFTCTSLNNFSYQT